MEKKVVGVFAKQPLPGRVKTRMCPLLSPSEAALLYETSLLETIFTMRDGDFDLVLFYTGDVQWFRTTFPDLRLIPQQGSDLGERMATALQQLHADYPKAALIGSDSPDLPTAMVEKAFNSLDSDGLVVIPARDGGYVMIAERGHHPQVFRTVPWSTAEVLTSTRRLAAEHFISLQEVGGWEDLDDVDSLQNLLQRSPSSRTAAFVRENFRDRLSV